MRGVVVAPQPQAAEAGAHVVLHEMRPHTRTAAHKTDDFGELVCSNSLKSESEHSAPWLLKRECRVVIVGGGLPVEIHDEEAALWGRPRGIRNRESRDHVAVGLSGGIRIKDAVLI